MTERQDGRAPLGYMVRQLVDGKRNKHWRTLYLDARRPEQFEEAEMYRRETGRVTYEVMPMGALSLRAPVGSEVGDVAPVNEEAKTWVESILAGMEQDASDIVCNANPAEVCAMRFIVEATRAVLAEHERVCYYCDANPCECEEEEA